MCGWLVIVKEVLCKAHRRNIGATPGFKGSEKCPGALPIPGIHPDEDKTAQSIFVSEACNPFLANTSLLRRKLQQSGS